MGQKYIFPRHFKCSIWWWPRVDELSVFKTKKMLNYSSGKVLGWYQQLCLHFAAEWFLRSEHKGCLENRPHPLLLCPTKNCPRTPLHPWDTWHPVPSNSGVLWQSCPLFVIFVFPCPGTPLVTLCFLQNILQLCLRTERQNPGGPWSQQHGSPFLLHMSRKNHSGVWSFQS